MMRKRRPVAPDPGQARRLVRRGRAFVPCELWGPASRVLFSRGAQCLPWLTACHGDQARAVGVKRTPVATK